MKFLLTAMIVLSSLSALASTPTLRCDYVKDTPKDYKKVKEFIKIELKKDNEYSFPGIITEVEFDKNLKLYVEARLNPGSGAMDKEMVFMQLTDTKKDIRVISQQMWGQGAVILSYTTSASKESKAAEYNIVCNIMIDGQRADEIMDRSF